jgi:hypothetical protein
MGMKIIHQLDGKTGSGSHTCLLKLSQSEWAAIGSSSGWSQEIEQDEPAKPVEPTENPEPESSILHILPALDPMDIEVQKYSNRMFAIYVNGNLLAVTAYKRGANAVKALLEQMWREYSILKEKLEAEMAKQEKQNGVLDVLVKERDSGDGHTIQETTAL